MLYRKFSFIIIFIDIKVFKIKKGYKMGNPLKYLSTWSYHEYKLVAFWYVILPLIYLFTSCPFHTSLQAQLKSEPLIVVEELQSTLIEVMKKGPEILYMERYEKLEPIINNTHQIPYITRLTVGKYWREMSDVDKDLFQSIFSKMVVSNYASNFKVYKGEYFKFVSEESLKRGLVVLTFDLYWANGMDSTRFNYILRQFDGKWKIVNIIVKGISDLALKRAEFTSVIENEGLKKLIERITDNVDEVQLRHEKQGT